MKILYISPKLPFPLDEGGKIAIYGEVKYLSLKGHSVDLVTYRKESDSDNSIKEMEKFCKLHLLDYSTENNYFRMLLNLFSNIPYNISKYHSNMLLEFLRDYLSENKPDVIQISNLHMGYVIDELRKISDAKIILRQHNVEGQIMRRFFEMEKNFFIKKYAQIQYKRFIKYEAELCAKFDHVAFITENDKNHLLNQNSKIKGSVIPAGIEKDYLKYEKKDLDQLSIFHTGSLKWLPNLDSAKFFIESILPLIVKKEPRVKFYLYGGTLPKSFEIPTSVKANVIQKGYVEDIWNEISSKFIAVVPLRIGSGMRLKVIELMATGNVIVSTSIGKEGIAANNNEHLFIEDEIEKFAEKCVQLLGKYESCLNMINNAKKFVEENYTWESIIEKYEEVYNQN